MSQGDYKRLSGTMRVNQGLLETQSGTTRDYERL